MSVVIYTWITNYMMISGFLGVSWWFIRSFICALNRVRIWVLSLIELPPDLLFQWFELFLLCPIPRVVYLILRGLACWIVSTLSHSISIVARLERANWLLCILILITALHMEVVFLVVALHCVHVKSVLAGERHHVLIVVLSSCVINCY